MIFERPLNVSSEFASNILNGTEYVAWISWGIFDLPTDENITKLFGDVLVPDGHLFTVKTALPDYEVYLKREK